MKKEEGKLFETSDFEVWKMFSLKSLSQDVIKTSCKNLKKDNS